MKNAIIYCFSGTGNTEKAAGLFAAGLSEKNVGARIYKLTGNLDDLPAPDTDYVGFAYPIHAFNAPHIMLDLAKKLPARKGKKYFIIKTSGEPLALNNISSLKFSDILRRKGYVLNEEYHYVMPYNMIFRHTDGMAAKMYRAMKAFIPIDVSEVVEGKKRRLKSVPFGRLTAFIFRIEHPAMRINGKYFRVDENKCVKCGKCVRECPEHNISMSSDGKFSFGNKCLMCARCSFGCPENAVSIGVLDGWRVNGAYRFDGIESMQTGKHAGFCRKAYEKYFARAEKAEKPSTNARPLC
jgi:ferredoxin/flavodoxin